MSTAENPNLLSKIEWKDTDRLHWVLTARMLDIHHMVKHYFGVQKRRNILDPLMDLYVYSNEDLRSVLDSLVHMDFMDENANNLKPGLEWRDCPSTEGPWGNGRGNAPRYLTIFYNHPDEYTSSYIPYDLGLTKPKRLQRSIPPEDRHKFMKDLVDLENLVKMCLDKLRPLMTSIEQCKVGRALTKIDACKSIISTLP